MTLRVLRLLLAVFKPLEELTSQKMFQVDSENALIRSGHLVLLDKFFIFLMRRVMGKNIVMVGTIIQMGVHRDSTLRH